MTKGVFVQIISCFELLDFNPNVSERDSWKGRNFRVRDALSWGLLMVHAWLLQRPVFSLTLTLFGAIPVSWEKYSLYTFIYSPIRRILILYYKVLLETKIPTSFQSIYFVKFVKVVFFFYTKERPKYLMFYTISVSLDALLSPFWHFQNCLYKLWTSNIAQPSSDPQSHLLVTFESANLINSFSIIQINENQPALSPDIMEVAPQWPI